MATDQTYPLARYAHNADGSIAGWFCFPPPPLFGRCALCVTFACVSLNACFEPVLMRLKLRCLRCFSSGGVTQAQLRAVDTVLIYAISRTVCNAEHMMYTYIRYSYTLPFILVVRLV